MTVESTEDVEKLLDLLTKIMLMEALLEILESRMKCEEDRRIIENVLSRLICLKSEIFTKLAIV